MSRYLILIAALFSSGCTFLPEVSHQPTVHNPFPQLSKVAVVPFFNLSTEPTVDGRQFAMAYFNELQLVPGFEVVPIGVVETAIIQHQINLDSPDSARRLAQQLGADAVVIGAVTDFTPYYPPRCALQVEWYSANPGFHPIPPGYGLPWGTPGEEEIPGPLVFEAEMALARAQLETQTPPIPVSVDNPSAHVQQASAETASGDTGSLSATDEPRLPGLPADWPDARGFIPTVPHTGPPRPELSDAPVIRHTKTYNGHDNDFTEALSSYYYFRDDARFGGWQSYLLRSDDFIRFCCHMHIWETLSARGGAGETRVVWRWPIVR